MSASEFDIVIIGAGIAGSSLAAELAAHHSVALLEREAHPGMHSTGRSAAMFHLTYGGPKVQPLSAHSLKVFESLTEPHWPNPVLSPRGMIMIADPNGVAALQEQIDGSGGALEPITIEQAKERFPLLREETLTAAAFDGAGQDIDVDGLHRGYLQRFSAADGMLACRSEIQSIERTKGYWQIQTAEQAYAAPIVVNAAGAWGDELAGLAGVDAIGLQPKLRTAALIDSPEGSNRWPMLIDSLETFYVKPDAGKFILSPADETDVPPHDAAADDYALAEGAERMSNYLDWEILKKPTTWAGLRTFSPDRIPAIGFDPDHEGFFWLVGQGGFGVQSSAGAAILGAHLIDPKNFELPEGITPEFYDPARFRS